MKPILRSIPIALFLLITSASPALADGKSLYKTKECGLCHGADAQGNNSIAKLAGKSSGVIQEQFLAIQAGDRKDGMARSMRRNRAVRSVTPDEIALIADYLSKL